MTTESATPVAFEHDASFAPGEIVQGLGLGKLETLYSEVFSDAIEDGVITIEERRELDKMADSLGLDRMQLHRLESALQAAYTAKHNVRIREMEDEEPPVASLQPLAPATDARTLALERRIAWLQGRVLDLERELEASRSQVAVEVDLSEVSAPGAPEDDPVELLRALKHDPRDVPSMRSLFRVWKKHGDVDGQVRVAHALSYLGAANEEEGALHKAHRPEGLVRPERALTADGWKLLFHADADPLVGEIFAVVAPAALLGRVSALRRDGRLPKLDGAKRHDPQASTVQAVRAFAWAGTILGLGAPPLFVEPDFSGNLEFVPALPPAIRLGHGTLTGRSARELAFIAGQTLASYRADLVVRELVPRLADLEEIFLAALSIGNPGLPLAPHVKGLVAPIAKAIEPLLESEAVDRLRGQFLRFVEEGGRTNLHRWAEGVSKTAARAGLLLSDDLHAAEKMLGGVEPSRAKETMDDLLGFLVSDKFARVRKQIGIATKAL